MDKQKIIFRADGNSEIGLGHVTRSLALAEMLKDDFICEFATRFTNEFIQKDIDRICSKTLILPQDDNLHFEYFLALLKGNEIVVLDNYFFTTDYQKQIKYIGCKLVCIDDLADKHFVADIVINHSGGVTKEDYSAEDYTCFYLGTNYALLRKSFFDCIEKEYCSNSILIATGSALNGFGVNEIVKHVGIDNFESIGLLINDFQFETLPFELINSPKVHIYKGLSAMEVKKLIDSYSIGIVSASTISYECMASGMLLYIMKTASNQEKLFDFLISNTLAIDFNDFVKKEISIEVIKKFVAKQNAFFNKEIISNINKIFIEL